MPIIWDQYWTDEELRAYARQTNRDRTIEQGLYKEVFRKLFDEIKQGKTVARN